VRLEVRSGDPSELGPNRTTLASYSLDDVSPAASGNSGGKTPAPIRIVDVVLDVLLDLDKDAGKS
jgi:hypothetical protein